MSEHDQQSSPITAPSWAASHVKGGTTTGPNDAREEAEFRGAEERRDALERDRRTSVTVPQAGAPEDRQDAVAGTIDQAVATERAVMFSYQPTENPNVPAGVIPVEYVNRHGEKYDEGVADLIMGTDTDPNELMIVLICPSCIARKRHAQDCVIQVRQKNRNFSFRPAPRLFRDHDGLLQRALGVIEESERFSCPQCSWRARFDNNRLRED